MDTHFVKTFSYGLANGLCKIHETGILHNNLTVSNILLRSSKQPVIHDFSWSCREESAHLLTIHQKEYFEEALHLPDSVRSGKEKPSKISDMYSFGQILLRICSHAKNYENDYSGLIRDISKPCLLKKGVFNLWVLVDDKLNNL